MIILLSEFCIPIVRCFIMKKILCFSLLIVFCTTHESWGMYQPLEMFEGQPRYQLIEQYEPIVDDYRPDSNRRNQERADYALAQQLEMQAEKERADTSKNQQVAQKLAGRAPQMTPNEQGERTQSFIKDCLACAGVFAAGLMAYKMGKNLLNKRQERPLRPHTLPNIMKEWSNKVGTYLKTIIKPRYFIAIHY